VELLLVDAPEEEEEELVTVPLLEELPLIELAPPSGGFGRGSRHAQRLARTSHPRRRATT
jgi:hypothetical protein